MIFQPKYFFYNINPKYRLAIFIFLKRKTYHLGGNTDISTTTSLSWVPFAIRPAFSDSYSPPRLAFPLLENEFRKFKNSSVLDLVAISTKLKYFCQVFLQSASNLFQERMPVWIGEFWGKLKCNDIMKWKCVHAHYCSFLLWK